MYRTLDRDVTSRRPYRLTYTKILRDRNIREKLNSVFIQIFSFVSSNLWDHFLRNFLSVTQRLFWAKNLRVYRQFKTVDISAPKLAPSLVPMVEAGKGRLQSRSSSLNPFALIPVCDRLVFFSCAFCLSGVDVEGRKRRCGTRIVGRRRIGLRVCARRQQTGR